MAGPYVCARTSLTVVIELETLAAFDSHVRDAGELRNAVVQGVDLSARTQALLSVDVAGAVFLGCTLEPSALGYLHSEEALVFPRFPDLPFRAFRASLYDAGELFAGYVRGRPDTLQEAFDSQVYAWYHQRRGRADVVEHLAQRIHDHAIDDALRDFLAADDRLTRVVAVMGGHSMGRDHPSFADVALLARTLTRAGFVCASGGGPGAMEATNLGAWMAPHPDHALDEALAVIAEAPAFEPVATWLDSALEVRQRWPRPAGKGVSLGIPTWHYGHEPPNVFASHVAKYFANSLREDGLLAIALAGVVFAPGSAGTIQEVFQDAAQNHYESFGVVSPMVFFGVDYWTNFKPVYPLLATLAEGHAYGGLLAIHDSVDEIVSTVTRRASWAPSVLPTNEGAGR